MSDRDVLDESINLEADALDELARAATCETELQETPEKGSVPLSGPHISRRCSSSERELLRNQFPAD